MLISFLFTVTARNASSLQATPGVRHIGELRASGEFIATNELDTTAAKVVRTADGPFAETAEWVGGYNLVDCASMGRVVEIAARFVEARYTAVELRAIVDNESTG